MADDKKEKMVKKEVTVVSEPEDAAPVPAVDAPAETSPEDAAPPVEKPATETAPEGVGDETAPATEDYRSKTVALLLERMPDIDVSSPEKEDQAIYETLVKIFKIQDKLSDLAFDEPEFAAALRDALKGSNMRTALLRYYGPEAFAEPVEGDPDYEEYQKYGSERSEKRKKFEERQKMLKKNEEVSLNEIKAFLEDRGWDDDRANEFVEKADKFFADVFDGKIMKDHLEMLERAFGYEAAVEEARQEGEVKGRNEKIIEKKISKAKMSDGLPETPSGGDVAPKKKRRGGLLEELYN